MVVGGGFEPPKGVSPTDLQSVPIDRSGILPRSRAGQTASADANERKPDPCAQGVFAYSLKPAFSGERGRGVDPGCPEGMIAGIGHSPLGAAVGCPVQPRG